MELNKKISTSGIQIYFGAAADVSLDGCLSFCPGNSSSKTDGMVLALLTPSVFSDLSAFHPSGPLGPHLRRDHKSLISWTNMLQRIPPESAVAPKMGPRQTLDVLMNPSCYLASVSLIPEIGFGQPMFPF